MRRTLQATRKKGAALFHSALRAARISLAINTNFGDFLLGSTQGERDAEHTAFTEAKGELLKRMEEVSCCYAALAAESDVRQRGAELRHDESSEVKSWLQVSVSKEKQLKKILTQVKDEFGKNKLYFQYEIPNFFCLVGKLLTVFFRLCP